MLAAASRKLNMSDYDEWKYRTDRDATILAARDRLTFSRNTGL
jgi:hypothetical protein